MLGTIFGIDAVLFGYIVLAMDLILFVLFLVYLNKGRRN